MSEEIKVSFNLQVANGFLTDRVALGQVSIDQATAGRGGNTQTFTESESAVSQDGVTTEGVVFMRNLEAAGGASFEWGPEAGTTGVMSLCGVLAPGEFAFFRLSPGVQLYGRSAPVGTGGESCKVDIRVYEN
jgi:hypothetical protein